MGAVTFSIDIELVKFLKKTLPSLDMFVETGTFKGDTVASVKSFFQEIITIELAEEYYHLSRLRFYDDAKVKVIQGDSAQQLKKCQNYLASKSVIYWLDAHWCVAENTAGAMSQCPLLSELAAINHLNNDSVILIDDARLFLAPPLVPHEITDWPSFNDILAGFKMLSTQHSLMILNDCILFYPSKIERDLRAFSHHNGVDWLTILDLSRNYQNLLNQLGEKDEEIDNLKRECNQKDQEIVDKQAEIVALQEICNQREHEMWNKEQEIADLSRICELRSVELGAKQQVIEVLQSACEQRESELLSKENEIVKLIEVCDKREQVILTLNKKIFDLKTEYQNSIGRKQSW